MPKLDGTGPQGKGPLTGQKKGNCQGAKKSTPAFGLGLGLRQRRRVRAS